VDVCAEHLKNAGADNVGNVKRKGILLFLEKKL
jgi:hypothetical protein